MINLSNKLSLNIKNSTVTQLKGLVESKLDEISSSNKSAMSSVSSAANAIKTNAVGVTSNVTEFTKDLYDKALSLPEAASTQLNKASDAIQQHVTFNGKIYSTFSGVLDESKSKISQVEGWLTPVNSSNTYALFSNAAKSYIVSYADIIPTPIVEDFMPLYEKLRSVKDDTIKQDVNLKSSLETTLSEEVSEKIADNETEYIHSEADKVIAISDLHDENKKEAVAKAKDKRIEYTYYSPGQVELKQNNVTSIKNDIQAIIYDMPNGNENSDNAQNWLLCYQQPESISYTAQASFESQSSRGTQQPFQFYSNANAIEINFVLKWHHDEVRTLQDPSGQIMSLQKIAEIAESFTRPWEFGNSVKPKLCKVILPGISEIGYITSAAITYSGDMSGTNAGVTTNNESGNIVFDYYYTQLEVTFGLLVVKDIKLYAENSVNGINMFTFPKEQLVYTSGSDFWTAEVTKSSVNSAEVESNKQKNSEEVTSEVKEDISDNFAVNAINSSINSTGISTPTENANNESK